MRVHADFTSHKNFLPRLFHLICSPYSLYFFQSIVYTLTAQHRSEIVPERTFAVVWSLIDVVVKIT